jgi:predicted lipoprotein with Yx(FWY)xxD motif
MKSTITRAALVISALILSAAAAQAAAMLTAPNGMTLYVFDKDKGGVSSCYDNCAKKWPAYLGKEGDKMTEGWTIVKRTDGSMQLAYDSKPTYFFKNDKKEGDMKGDGMGGVWHIVTQ